MTASQASSALSRAQLDEVLRTVMPSFALTDEQWAAVSSALEPAVIVAGAGSGKTTSMAARVAWLVGSGHVRPDAVLGLTFTTKATAQLLGSMRQALSALVRSGVLAATDVDDVPWGDPNVLTYHAFAARILAENGIRIGREPEARVLTEAARHQLAYRVVCRSALPLHELETRPIDLTSAALQLDDQLTELRIDPHRLKQFDGELLERLSSYGPPQRTGESMMATARGRALLADLVLEWRAEKAVRDVIDFADQIRLAGDVVERYADVAAQLRERFAVVLLDEYQDTSIAQRMLLQTLFGNGHPVTAVGDPCQAIYGWRGASVDNIERFPVHFPAGSSPSARFPLSENRRSGPAILEVANRASSDLRAAHSGVEPLAAGPNGKGPGVVACALWETHAEEVDWLVAEVVATQTEGDDVRWRDIAVLAATTGDLARVESALRRRGVPTQLIGSAALLGQPAVVDLRSTLEVLLDPSANPAFVRLAAGPRWRIGPRDLAALGDRAAELAGSRRRSAQEAIEEALDDAVAGTDAVELVSLSEALENPGDPARYSADAVLRFGAFAAELAELRSHVGEPLTDFLLRVLRATGLEVEVWLGPPEAAELQHHAVHAFVDVAAEFVEVDGRQGLGAFLSFLRDAERFDVDLGFEPSAPQDAVQLLTVHKAKGLEFPYVFVPFVSKDAFPGGRGRRQWPTSAEVVPWPLRDDATDELADFPPDGETPRGRHLKAYREVLRGLADLDARRLAYVAFTRAERGLVVSGHWWGPSQAKPRGPSEFLEVVREACDDGGGTVIHWAEPPVDGVENPLRTARSAPTPWPMPPDPDHLGRLRRAAGAVRAQEGQQLALPGPDLSPDPRMTVRERALVAEWVELSDALINEAQQRTPTVRGVRLPESVSASMLARALEAHVAGPDAVEQVAWDIVRPMPRPPAPAARRGTEFHAWVESRFGQQSLLEPDDLPGAADEDIASDAALAELKAAFEGSQFAGRIPVGVEVPFALLLGGRVVNGRIDAVFGGTESGVDFDIIDWKTGSGRGLDPMQLAIYRLAWSQRTGVPVERIAAGFYVVGPGQLRRPDTDRALDALLRLA